VINDLDLVLVARPGRMREAWASLLQSFPGLKNFIIVDLISEELGQKLFPKPGLIIIENKSPGQEGLNCLRQVKVIYPTVPCIVIVDELKHYQDILAAGACEIITSQQNIYYIFDVMEKVCSRRD
jgi:hypothetical protein